MFSWMNRFSLTSQSPADKLFTTKIGNNRVKLKNTAWCFFLLPTCVPMCCHLIGLTAHYYRQIFPFLFFSKNNLCRSITKQDLESWLCSALVIQGVGRIDSVSQLQGEVWTCLTGITAGQHEICPPRPPCHYPTAMPISRSAPQLYLLDRF